jgi:hypothetical protein
MSHVRSKAAVALVAALLASCTGVGRQSAGLPPETPPQVLEAEAPAGQAPVGLADASVVPSPEQADEDQNIVVTGTSAERRGRSSSSRRRAATAPAPAFGAYSPA